MADNLAVTAGSGTNIASDEVSYSGDTAKLGIVRLVHVTGSEGSKTVSELVRLEDAAHTSGDPGIPMLGVRSDTAASLAGTDGDYTLPIFDSSGRQHVNVGASALPSGAATAAKQPALGTAGSPSADVISIQGVASGTVVPVSDGGGSLTVDGTVSVTGVATSANQSTQITAEQAIQTSVELIDDTVKAEDAAHSSGDKGIMGLSVRQDTAAALSGTDGDYQPIITDGSGRVHVNVGTSALPTGAATSAKQDTIIGHLDGVETLLGTIDSDTSTLAGAVAGTEMQVDIVGALPAGTNAIGKLAANSGVDIGDVDVASLPALAAGTNLIGRTSASAETSTIYNGTTALTPKFAVVAASSSGDNEIVAAVTSKKIRVLNYVLVSNGTVNAKWQSATAGDITGLAYLIANTGVSSGYAPTGHFETAAGEALQLNLSGAVAVGGHISYIEV